MAGILQYTDEEKAAIYELGRLYFEMGYFAPAERIFNGLAVIDNGFPPARLGLGLVKLERGLHQEAATHFRAVLQDGALILQAKLGLCAVFLATGDMARAQTILAEISKSIEAGQSIDAEMRRLFEAFILRCRSSARPKISK